VKDCESCFMDSRDMAEVLLMYRSMFLDNSPYDLEFVLVFDT
jgi:hypothetical protein